MSDPRRIVPTLGTSVPRLLDQISALRYVTAENAPNYRAIVQVFSEARERYEIELRPSDVRERLARSGLHHDLPADADLDRHLDQLVAWGNLQRSHDTANVARVADFYLRRFTYRLTPVGEAAQRAVAEVEATVGRSGALQTSMLVEIRDALAALVWAQRGGDAAGLARAFHRLHAAFASLTEEANLFLGELDRHVSQHTARCRALEGRRPRSTSPTAAPGSRRGGGESAPRSMPPLAASQVAGRCGSPTSPRSTRASSSSSSRSSTRRSAPRGTKKARGAREPPTAGWRSSCDHPRASGSGSSSARPRGACAAATTSSRSSRSPSGSIALGRRADERGAAGQRGEGARRAAARAAAAPRRATPPPGARARGVRLRGAPPRC